MMGCPAEALLTFDCSFRISSSHSTRRLRSASICSARASTRLAISLLRADAHDERREELLSGLVWRALGSDGGVGIDTDICSPLKNGETNGDIWQSPKHKSHHL
jgi:hypothetical protein